MFNYIVDHPGYWNNFKPFKINVDKIRDPSANPQKLAPGTRKLVMFLELVNNGTPKEEALELCAHIAKVRAKKAAGPSGVKKKSNLNFRRKKITNQPTKVRIKPKSKTKPLTRLSRDNIEKLEKLFLMHTCKPKDVQTNEWAKDLNVEHELVSNWFNIKWRGKLDFEANKSREEGADTRRSRGLQKFDTDTAIDAFTDALDDEDDFVIEHNNAEDDE